MITDNHAYSSSSASDEYKGYIAKIEGNSLKDSLMRGLEWVGWKDIVKVDATVFVKPNLTWPKYRPGVTTSPDLLRALLLLLKDRANKIIIGESDLPNFSADKSFYKLGITRICNEIGCEQVNLSKQEASFYWCKLKRGTIKVELPKFLISEVDVFISVPVMHTHVVTTVSLSLKNQFGVIPNPRRGLIYHINLDKVIVAVNKLLSPKIAIIDGIYAGNKRGPIFCEPIKLDALVVSNNTVLADSIGCEVMGVNRSRVKHLTLAGIEGLGPTNFRTALINEEVRPLSDNFKPKRELLDYLSLLTFKSRTIANLVFDSMFTPYIYRMIQVFRSSKEKDIIFRDLGP